jgi:hypothetical protein
VALANPHSSHIKARFSHSKAEQGTTSARAISEMRAQRVRVTIMTTMIMMITMIAIML